MLNPNPIIFPKLIDLWNESPLAYFNFLYRWYITVDDATMLLGMIQEWIEEQNYNILLNE